MRTFCTIAALALAVLVIAPAAAQAQQPPMSFFVTSVGGGDGGNLGGLAGADAHCQMLATAAGAGNRTWHAYMSQAQAGGRGQPPTPPVNARDRIGSGPWYNANGALIAANVDDLHMDRNNIRKPTALTENGDMVNGVGDQPNQHDMLTGSDSTGRVIPGAANLVTCNNWTSNSPDDHAMLGHMDRLGGNTASWNSVHGSAGCSQENLVQTGGAGLFYCFAID